MKYLCNVEFVHSGCRTYNAGTVYQLSAEDAQKLIALDKKKALGALSFFTAADEAAVDFLKTALHGTGTADTGAGETKTPVKADLVAEAEALGIELKGTEKCGQIQKLIDAKKAEQKSTGGGENPNKE
jgi:hypothetical protein